MDNLALETQRLKDAGWSVTPCQIGGFTIKGPPSANFNNGWASTEIEAWAHAYAIVKAREWDGKGRGLYDALKEKAKLQGKTSDSSSALQKGT